MCWNETISFYLSKLLEKETQPIDIAVIILPSKFNSVYSLKILFSC